MESLGRRALLERRELLFKFRRLLLSYDLWTTSPFLVPHVLLFRVIAFFPTLMVAQRAAKHG